MSQTQLKSQAIQQPSWTAATLLNGWVNFGTGYQTASYTKDAAGIVHIKGLVKSGTATQSTVIFTLPAGYRPLNTMLFAVVTSADIFGEIRVDASGNVMIFAGNNTYLSLDGITFVSEQ